MAPKKWATAAEQEFLERHYQSYLEHKAKKDLAHFWKPVCYEFFKLFPEKEKMFGSDIATLTSEQRTALTSAISKRSQPAGRRRLQPVELYSRKYYDEKIKPRVAEEIERKKSGKSETLAVIKRVTREVFEDESEEVKAEIQAEIEAHNVAADAEDVDNKPSPLQHQLALDNMPTLLKDFLHELSHKTGWCFTVLGGGPVPQERGEIRTISIHEGKTESGHTFADSIDIKARCIKPFAESVSAVYPKEIRASYVIGAPQQSASPHTGLVENLSSESEAQLDPPSEREAQSDPSTGLGEGESVRWAVRHPSLPCSLHPDSASPLPLPSRSETMGLMLDVSGSSPTLPVFTGGGGSSSIASTADSDGEMAATQELSEMDSNSHANPFSYDLAQFEEMDLVNITLSPQSISLLDELFPNSAQPLDFIQNVAWNGATTPFPASVDFRSDIATSGLLVPAPPASVPASETLMPMPPASISASETLVPTLPASVVAASETLVPVLPASVAASETLLPAPPASVAVSEMLLPAPPASVAASEMLAPALPASVVAASETLMPTPPASVAVSETEAQKSPPHSSLSASAATCPVRSRRAPPHPDATPPPLSSRVLPLSRVEQSSVENVESGGTVEAGKRRERCKGKGKENAMNSSIQKSSRKRGAASQGGRKGKQVRI